MTGRGKRISHRLGRAQLLAAATGFVLALPSCTSSTGPDAAGVTQPVKQVIDDTRPNILLIVADDLGYSDIGAFGGEIATPNLDALAKKGSQLVNFYVSPACSPTRAMLLTGKDNHQAGFGTMQEVALDEQRGVEGYEGYIPRSVPTIAERLARAGYRTLMAGKWHLGPGPGQGPADRGFQRSFALIEGAANHFGADQTSDYEHYNASPTYRLDGKAVSYPKGQYSSHVFSDQLIDFMQDRQSESRHPFFAYLAFTAPHWPLQAPADAIARNHGKYDTGPGAVARSRMERMKQSGLIRPGFHSRVDTSDKAWSVLSPEARAHEARKMEVYAAMVEEMDAAIGRVIPSLERSGELKNTYIVFMSDNGAEGLTFSRPVNPMEPGKPLPVTIDNSTANLGADDSYFIYGPIWGQASATPFWGTKEHTSEGGIRSAAIVAGPKIPAKTRERSVLHVRDIFPTLLSIAGLGQAPPIADPEMLPINILPLLEDGAEGPTLRKGGLFWELFYRAAWREGNMKAIYQPTRIPVFGKQSKPGDVPWQLYDLAKDPGEANDLAKIDPGELQRLKAEWRRHADKLGVVLLPEDR